MTSSPNDLASQALDNLVNQFARPLDCLRELVQNAIDAGTPRIEVRARWSPTPQGPTDGVLSLHVDDFGEGMDEAIIDGQLTKMFSSAKEGDLTKIGKFGIGFTSIFAIQPEAVLLRTGRNDTSWELLFHADRSYDKRQIDTPVAGTKITLFKRMSRAEVDPYVAEAREVLSYWVQHATLPITWHDETEGPADEEVAVLGDDPFAAFDVAEPSVPEGERVSLPLDLPGADVKIHRKEEGREIVVGYADQPRHGFYSGGLTLIADATPDALDRYAAPLGHLSFKVRDERVEHTLTRDNVMKDAHWVAALEAVRACLPELRTALLDAVAQAVVSGAPLEMWHWRLAWEASDPALVEVLRSQPDRPLARDLQGRPRTLAEIDAQERKLGFVVLASSNPGIHAALNAQGHHVLDGGPSLTRLLEALAPRSLFGARRRTVLPASQLFVAPEVLEPIDLPPLERTLFQAASRLLGFATEGRLDLQVGDFGGAEAATREPLCLEGPTDEAIFRRDIGSTWWPTWLRSRTVLVNRHHPTLLSIKVLAAESPAAGAHALATAVLAADGQEGAETWTRAQLAVRDLLEETA